MSTLIRPEISMKNKYWISKHRYYELKHFCLQYEDWRKMYLILTDTSIPSVHTGLEKQAGNHSDPTARRAILAEDYSRRINIVEKCAKESDDLLWTYILKGVTENRSYEYLSTKLNMPCCRDTYYDRYRKFFWLLNKER
jgi:hypothetical protein